MSDPEREGGEGLDLPARPRDSIVLLTDAAKAIDARPRKAKGPSPAGGKRRRRSARAHLGRAGFLVVMTFLAVAAFADFLACDLPIACTIHGHTFVFPNVTRPAALTSMSREERAQQTTWSIPALVSYGPSEPTSAGPLTAPREVSGHPLGTDLAGRDVFARVIHGTRAYVVFAVAAVFASLVLGGFVGALAGTFGGTVDAIAARMIETVSAFPALVLVLGIQAAVPNATLATLFFAIAATRWPEVARLVRAEVIRITTRDYILAARALGASPWRILRRHVMPHVRSQIAVVGAFGVPAVILVEASLDFLRVGPTAASQPANTGRIFATAASWGELMSEFRDAPHAWWLLVFPGLFLFLFVVALNVAAEARRDALDPRGR